MKRENRFLVLKVENIEDFLTPDQKEALIEIENTIYEAREEDGKERHITGVVIRNRWPMYNDTYKALNDWVDSLEAKQ